MLNILYIGNNSQAISAFKEYNELFSISHVSNGLKAAAYINDGNNPDAIVCEARLSGMNAISVGKLIKGIDGFSSTPFIIFLFEKDVGFTQNAFRARKIVNDVYYFPFDLNRLFIRLQFILKYYDTFDSFTKPELAYKGYSIPIIKRVFDAITSSLAIIILSPILLLTALAIRIESKGAVIYKSKRVGSNYNIFNFLKFRSMYVGADKHLGNLKHLNVYTEANDGEPSGLSYDCPRCKNLPKGEHCSPVLFINGNEICEYWYIEQKRKNDSSAFIKIDKDPRVSKVGNFIRKTSIDELPQLINVLKGDMSIVGNRPLPLYEAELLTSDDWSARFMGPAGITGLWQVELRGKKGVMSNEERKSLDNKYAETYSFFGDMKLILRTIPALFQKADV